MDEVSTGTSIGLMALQVVGPIVVSLIGWGVAELARLIRARVKNEAVAGILVRLTDSVHTSVKSLNQTLVTSMRDAREDGKLTRGDVVMLKKSVLREVKSYWGERGWKELQSVLGINSMEAESVIASKVEAAVSDLKAAGLQKKLLKPSVNGMPPPSELA